MYTIDLRLLGLQNGDQFLDVGCGNGRHSWGMYKVADCSVFALDIGQEDLQRARYTFTMLDEQDHRPGTWLAIRGDAGNLPFRDSSFDKVVCSEVLEHLPDDNRGVKELVRVLKEGGILAVSVPNYFPEAVYWRLSRSYHNTPGGHIRIYRKKGILDLLGRHGLRVLAIHYKHSLHTPYWLLRCIFGIDNKKALIPSLYHKLLVWDLRNQYRIVRLLDDICNRIFPKSIVIYAKKGDDEG